MAKYDLAKFRRDHGLTQKQLAEALNVTQGFLSSVENGRTPFPEERKKDFELKFPEVDLEDYRSIDDYAEEIKEMDGEERQEFLDQFNSMLRNLVKKTIEKTGIPEEYVDECFKNISRESDDDEKENVAETDQPVEEEPSTPMVDLDLGSSKTSLQLEKATLQEKNDELRDKLHEARTTIFNLQNEILRLKSILIEHKIADAVTPS